MGGCDNRMWEMCITSNIVVTKIAGKSPFCQNENKEALQNFNYFCISYY